MDTHRVRAAYVLQRHISGSSPLASKRKRESSRLLSGTDTAAFHGLRFSAARDWWLKPDSPGGCTAGIQQAPLPVLL